MLFSLKTKTIHTKTGNSAAVYGRFVTLCEKKPSVVACYRLAAACRFLTEIVDLHGLLWVLISSIILHELPPQTDCMNNKALFYPKLIWFLPNYERCLYARPAKSVYISLVSGHLGSREQRQSHTRARATSYAVSLNNAAHSVWGVCTTSYVDYFSLCLTMVLQ